MKVRISFSRKMFVAGNTLFLVILSLSFVIPMLSVVTASIVGQAERMERGSFILFPRSVDLTGYRILLGRGSIMYGAYGNTLFVVIVGTFLSLMVSAMLAYAISKKDLPGRKGILIYCFVTMIFSGGLIPTYLLVNFLGLVDNIWVLIIPYLMSVWNMFILRNFFYSIPFSLEESALLDGAGPFTVFLRIVLPLSKAALATIGMFYAVGYWNSWFPGAIYLNTISKLPVQNVMRNIIQSFAIADINNEAINDERFLYSPPIESLQMASVVVGTLPIMLVYPFIQKYFVKGVMIGSIKG